MQIRNQGFHSVGGGGGSRTLCKTSGRDKANFVFTPIFIHARYFKCFHARKLRILT